MFFGEGGSAAEKYIEEQPAIVDSLYEIVNLSVTDLSSRNSIWTYVCAKENLVVQCGTKSEKSASYRGLNFLFERPKLTFEKIFLEQSSLEGLEVFAME